MGINGPDGTDLTLNRKHNLTNEILGSKYHNVDTDNYVPFGRNKFSGFYGLI